MKILATMYILKQHIFAAAINVTPEMMSHAWG
jgi:hypothetical protein